MKKFHALLPMLLLVLMLAVPCRAAESLKLAVPPWPGVEVKSEIAIQLLDALGYPAEKLSVGPPIAYNGMANGEVDIFLAGWLPQQNPLLDPLLEKKAVEVVQTNLDSAVISLCVTKDVADQGVKSFADLDKHADKFKHHLFNIESGSPMAVAMGEIIEKDVAGLGDWEQTNVTTPIMLKEVQSRVNNGEWVTFACWKPHWMNLQLDMAYLEAVPGTEKFASKSKVVTVARKGLAEEAPEVYRFLKQLKVPSATQSKWILEYGQKEIPSKEVAATWIANNKDAVAAWLKGVKAADGTPAMDVINKSF